MKLKGLRLPASNRQRAELAVLSAVLFAFTTGPVYFVAQHVFHSESSWEARPIKWGFMAAGAAGVCVWLSMVAAHRIKRLDLPLIVGGCFAAAAFASTLWSILPRQTLWRSSVYLAMFLVAWALASLSFDHLWTVLLAFSGFATFFSIAVALLRPSIGVAESTNWRGIFTSPNSLGPVAAIFIIGVGGTALLNSDLRVRLGSAAAAAISVIPLLKSSAETAVMALALSVGVALGMWVTIRYWSRRRRRRSLQVGLLGAIVAISVAVIAVPPAVGSSGIELRREVWRVVWERILVKPTLGYGFFTYWGTRDSMSPRTLARAGSAHNSVLEAGLDLGFVGMALVILMLALAVGLCVRRLLREPGLQSALLLALALFIMLSHMTESFMSWFSYLWIMLIVVASHDPTRDTRT